jgi:Ca2+-transporting ATPase
VEGLAKALGSDATVGLDPAATEDFSIETHRKVFGANRFKEQPPKNFFMLVWENLQDPIVQLLCAAALVSCAAAACQLQGLMSSSREF